MKDKNRHVYTELPEGYRCATVFKMDESCIDVLRELSRLEILISALLFLAGIKLCPISAITAMAQRSDSPMIRILAIPAVIFLCLFLHEVTHIAFMKLFGSETVKVETGRGVAATGSSEYYDAFSFYAVSLAPCVIWGVVFTVLCAAVPQRWFWTVYPMLLVNFSGSVSDFYAVHLMRKAAPGSLVRDSGFELSVFSPDEAGRNGDGTD